MSGEGHRWMRQSKYIKIHPSVWGMILFFLFLGKGSIFLWTILFVTIHELSHVASALALGAKFSKILITPIGEQAVIRNLERLERGKQFFILMIGPLVNLTIGLFFKTCFPSRDTIRFLGDINLAIGFFNLLPVLPLDGGRILLLFAQGRWGTLNAASWIVKMGKGLSILAIFLGMIQMILYPFNFSLLLAGFYLLECNKKEYLSISSSFFLALLKKKKVGERPLRLKEILVQKNTRLGQIIRFFNYDCYYLVCFYKDGQLIKKTQTEIMESILEKGMLSPIENS